MSHGNELNFVLEEEEFVVKSNLFSWLATFLNIDELMLCSVLFGQLLRRDSKISKNIILEC